MKKILKAIKSFLYKRKMRKRLKYKDPYIYK